MKKITRLKIPELNAFDFQIKYTETNQKDHWYQIDLHVHHEFELYINLEGDISFLVDDALYPVSRGDVIIARPGEQHHCVYRSSKPHKLYWILFDCDKNSGLLDFMQPECHDNFISTQGKLCEELLELCGAMCSKELSKEEQIYAFFRIFAILKESKKKNAEVQDVLPQDLAS